MTARMVTKVQGQVWEDMPTKEFGPEATLERGILKWKQKTNEICFFLCIV